MNAPLQPLPAAARDHFRWLDDPALKAVIAALEAAEPGSARFVGGCVRDSLLGAKPKDFDVATTLRPEEATAALKAAGLRVAPTGLDHGTVTAISDHQGVEVTSLRADLTTDGRRATVAFTRDWAVDAGRRDFTINAVYLTPSAELYDPVGGVADAAARRVRFIGDPAARIAEDYLRILRFFRFTARFSENFDEAGLAACACAKDGMKILSAERVGAETCAILSLPAAAFAIEAMAKAAILSEVWPAEPEIEVLRALKRIRPDAPAPLGLAALWGERGEGIGARLRLSNAERAIRSAALKRAGDFAPEMDEKSIRALVYRAGRDVFCDAAALAAARGLIGEDDYARMIALGESWTPPTAPISGRDALAAGLEPGPQIAAMLKAFEEQWIAEDFPPTARAREIFDECLAATLRK